MASPYNQGFNSSAYNPAFRPSPHRPDPYQQQSSESPERSHPVHPTFAAEVPRDIPRQGQFTPHERYAPPGVYETSPYHSADPYSTSPAQAQMYGTSPSQQQYLAPYPSQQSYPPPPRQHYSDEFRRTRSSSTDSRRSHHSHRSHRSSTSHRSGRPHHGKSHRKNSRVESPRPTLSDSVMLMWNSIKGAFDARK